MFEMMGQYMIVGMVCIIFIFAADQYKVMHKYSSYQIQKGVFYDIENNTNIVSVNDKEDVLLNNKANSGDIYIYDPNREHQSEKLTDKNLEELYDLSSKSFFFRTPDNKPYYNP